MTLKNSDGKFPKVGATILWFVKKEARWHWWMRKNLKVGTDTALSFSFN